MIPIYWMILMVLLLPAIILWAVPRFDALENRSGSTKATLVAIYSLLAYIIAAFLPMALWWRP